MSAHSLFGDIGKGSDCKKQPIYIYIYITFNKTGAFSAKICVKLYVQLDSYFIFW
jgi:hypothetical protein